LFDIYYSFVEKESLFLIQIIRTVPKIITGANNKYKMPVFKLLAYSDFSAVALHIGHCACNEKARNMNIKVRNNGMYFEIFI
jgi:hypothetical protein